jgi:outer membrane protein OmpA-like peptidoglycan-associated protein
MKTQWTVIAALGLFVAACGSSAPSRELVDARKAYDRAARARAAELTPASLLSARQALDAAEKAHKNDPGSERERSYAYVAKRRSELAIVYGDTQYERMEQQRAEQDYAKLQDSLRASATANLEDSRERVESLNAALKEQSARTADAELRARSALASLNQIAQVKEESRGTVITLSGQVLFLTGKADLMPTARDALSRVAKALKDAEGDEAITIEGHTDSRGNEDENRELSQKRAENVREYLVSQGIDAQRVKAVGHGETQPVASNDTVEGRANNRRVEIVVGGRAAAANAQAEPAESGADGRGAPPRSTK